MGLWTAEDEKLLRSQWTSLSAVEMTRLFGGRYTRSAIIGKGNRLKLGSKRKPAAPKAAVRAPTIRRYAARPREVYTPSVVEYTPTATHILDLRRWHCRAVIGEPEALTFCGGHAPSGTSWCSAHRTIYTRPRP